MLEALTVIVTAATAWQIGFKVSMHAAVDLVEEALYERL